MTLISRVEDESGHYYMKGEHQEQYLTESFSDSHHCVLVSDSNGKIIRMTIHCLILK
jgi:hypothetical protein